MPLTVLREDQLYRDDAVTGDSVCLGTVDGPVDWAFSLPRTPNVILVAGEKEHTRLRMV